MKVHRYVGMVNGKRSYWFVLDILVIGLTIFLSGCGGGDGTTSSTNTSSEDISVDISTAPPPPPPPPSFVTSASFNAVATDLVQHDAHRSVYPSAVTQAEGSLPCNVLISEDPVPNGYGVPWNATSEEKELLVKTTCTDSTVNIEIGNGDTLQYIYNKGYFYQNNKWNIYALENCNRPEQYPASPWCIGSAEKTLSGFDMEYNNWIVAYLCSWIANERKWKCGCADSQCATNYWQLQAFPDSFRYPVDYRRDAPNGWNNALNSFGSLSYFVTSIRGAHRGEDWNRGTGADDLGEPVVAIADGVIEDIHDCASNQGRCVKAWGRVIVVKHKPRPGKYFVNGQGELIGNGQPHEEVYSSYWHLLTDKHPTHSDKYVPALNTQIKKGDSIDKGAPIGQVGDADGYVDSKGSGYSPHLHFEIRYVPTLDNPYDWRLDDHANPTELIDNNKFTNIDSPTGILPGTSVFVHPYEQHGSFLLDGLAPEAGGDCSYAIGILGQWQRAGCNTYSQIGYSGHYFYSERTVLSSTFGNAEWKPSLRKDGRYEIKVYVPDEHASTQNATYRVYNNFLEIDPEGLVPGGTNPRIVNQLVNQKFVSIGIYKLLKDQHPTVVVSTFTGEYGVELAADAIQFIYLGD